MTSFLLSILEFLSDDCLDDVLDNDSVLILMMTHFDFGCLKTKIETVTYDYYF